MKRRPRRRPGEESSGDHRSAAETDLPGAETDLPGAETDLPGAETDRSAAETDPDNNVVHRGVHWHRDSAGVMFYDQDSARWVRWAPGVDAPPLPPRWQLLGVPTKVSRPAWRTPWRVVPIVVVVGATFYAIYQGVAPGGNQTAQEAKQAQALLGKCLVANGTFDGHPRYSATPVSCSSTKAAAKVVSVIPSYPPGQTCPSTSVGVEIANLGAAHPYIECIETLAR